MSLSKDGGLQFGEVGESLEHIWSQAANPVVGQVTANRNKRDTLSNPEQQSSQTKTEFCTRSPLWSRPFSLLVDFEMLGSTYWKRPLKGLE